MKLSELLIPVHFLIPEQEFGEYCDSFQTQCYPNPKEAKEAFKVKSNVLLNINDWGTLEKKVMAKFELRDKKGELKKGQPEIGDLISIQLVKNCIVIKDIFLVVFSSAPYNLQTKVPIWRL